MLQGKDFYSSVAESAEKLNEHVLRRAWDEMLKDSGDETRDYDLIGEHVQELARRARVLLLKELNRLGAEGWELAVYYDEGIYILKRPRD